MRRVLSYSLALLSGLAGASYASPPSGAPEVPYERPVGAIPTLGELLRDSSFRPSALSKAALKAEGLDFDRDQPVLMQPIRAPGGFTLVGDIAVLEGDAQTVSSFSNGRYGLRYDNGRQDPITIAQRFIASHGDNYDFIAVWTTFWDYGADGLAYYVPIIQDTHGIGEQRFNQSRFWGSNGKLQGFLNMKSIDVYGNIRNPNNYVYPVIGQELTHRWLAYLKFTDASGQISSATLGRDDAHWSALLHAQGSVQDGNSWRDNGDGTFTLTENMTRFSDLDLYAMGLFEPSEVEPTFLIEDARYRGNSVNPAATLPVGAVVSGTRTDITIDQIISANGERRPSVADQQKDLRMAFILVTRPGETVADVQDQIEQIEIFRNIWEEKYSEWTHNRSFLCTRAGAACDRPALKVINQVATELDGDGDGMPEPGEKVAITLTIANQGGGTATSPLVHLGVEPGSGLSVGPTPVGFDDLPADQSVKLEQVFVLEIGAEATCGQNVTLPLEVITGDLVFYSSVTFPLGFDYLFYDDFSTDRGWKVNAQNEDTASGGIWERATPSGVTAAQVGLDFQTQPAGDYNGGGQALVTGATRSGGLGGNDVDDGSTSITSPPIPLAGAIEPYLGYVSWHTALDFNAQPNAAVPDLNDGLLVELSPDDGVTWITLEDDTTNLEKWSPKAFRLLDVLPELPASIRVRFTARDVDPQSLSEAAIDDFRVWDLQPSCFEPLNPTDPDPTEPDPTDPDPNDPNITPGEPAQPIRGKSNSGCAGADFGSAIFAIATLLAVFAIWRNRRR